MTISLSKSTRHAASAVLRAGDRVRIEARLEAEVAENVPMWHDYSPEGLERLRFAVIKLIGENRRNEVMAFRNAGEDWRDLLMAAGFGLSATEHERWYASLPKTP